MSFALTLAAAAGAFAARRPVRADRVPIAMVERETRFVGDGSDAAGRPTYHGPARCASTAIATRVSMSGVFSEDYPAVWWSNSRSVAQLTLWELAKLTARRQTHDA